MTEYNRREFLEAAAAAAGAPALLARPASVGGGGGAAPPGPRPKALRLGLIVAIGDDPEGALAKVHHLGLPTCQVLMENFDPALVDKVGQTLAGYKLEATALVGGGPGPEEYDFYNGPLTIGFVPRAYRQARIDRMKQASDAAKKLGIPAVQTHCGFIPENPNDPVYAETVAAIREVASYAKANGLQFRYETGQETPITLLRAIRDVGLDNQGVNFDCANLILYDKANPVDALDVLGPYVQGVHAKDGLYPTDPRNLGQEVPIGQGKVDFARIMARLKRLNYTGAITIEREISGPQQLEDVRREKAYLEKLMGQG